MVTLNLTINNCPTGKTLNITAFIQGYYIGTSSMTSVLQNQGVSNSLATQVDTITVELRDSINPSTVIASGKSLLMTNGNASITFNNLSTNHAMWIVIKHRNAIETWSGLPVALSPTTYYDFTNAASQAYGNNMAEVETGIWAFYSGDMNQDGFVDSFDFPAYDSDNLSFATGYLATDLNGDGFVDSFDFPTFDTNNINFISVINP